MKALALLARNLRAWPTLLRIGWAGMIAYRAEMVIWVLSATMPLVMLALWDAVAAGGPLGRYGQAEFARYFAITVVVRQLTSAWILWELNFAIRHGRLSSMLLKPAGALSQNLAETFAAIPVRATVMLPILGALFWWRPEIAWTPAPAALALFAASMGLAMLLNWCIQCSFAMLAFWFEQSIGVWGAWFALWAILSGYLVPAELLGGATAVARWLPFYSGMGAPIDLLMGVHPAPLAAIAAQAGWVAVAGSLAAVLWRRGLVRYGAFGA